MKVNTKLYSLNVQVTQYKLIYIISSKIIIIAVYSSTQHAEGTARQGLGTIPEEDEEERQEEEAEVDPNEKLYAPPEKVS